MIDFILYTSGAFCIGILGGTVAVLIILWALGKLTDEQPYIYQMQRGDWAYAYHGDVHEGFESPVAALLAAFEKDDKS